MTTFIHDLNNPNMNWCPVCGAPSANCICDESDFMAEAADDWNDEPRERVECRKCGGDGMLDDITPCPHCDGEGFEWWLD